VTALSPPVQRVVAVLLLVLLLAGATTLLVVPLTGAVTDALARLADSRFNASRLAVLSAQAVPRLPRLPTGLTFRTTTITQAQEQLLGKIRTAADDAKATLEVPQSLPQDPRDPLVITVHIRARGDEAAIAKLINNLEDEQPLVRFVEWQLTTAGLPKDMVAFEGNAKGVWEPAR
jgi:hypothetical protein